MKRFYGIDLDQSDTSPSSTAEVLGLFELLKPTASTTPLIRIGADRDGSYLVPDVLEGITACFSPGAARIKYFEDFLADQYSIDSHMCDFSCDIDDFRTPFRPGQTFRKKWLDPEPGPDNIKLETWINASGATGDLLLQMDIEGAEYRNILTASTETLHRFRVIVLELHGLRHMLDGPALRGAMKPFFETLSKSFTTVHAHPNNCCGDFEIPATDVRIPHVLELTLVRNEHFAPAAGPALLPHPLDIGRNVPRMAPLFLSDAWCDYRRPTESRIKMLEDQLQFLTANAEAVDDQLDGAVSMMMQSLQTSSRLASATPAPGDLAEVASGRPYELSSTFGDPSRAGIVNPKSPSFFHTQFGKGEWIRIDLGKRYRIQRIEVTNREGGLQERAQHIFALFEGGGSSGDAPKVIPMYQSGPLPGGAWQECVIQIPDIEARFVTITSPLRTALHFSDLRIYARSRSGSEAGSQYGAGLRRQPPRWTIERLRKGLRRRLRRLRGRLRAGSAS